MTASPARCGALTARGTPCRRPAVDGGPCAWHSRDRRPEPRVWTRAKRWRLMTYLERGWDDARIGAALGVSPDAAKLARRRYRIPARNQTVLTARAVAQRLGVGCAKTVVRWIEAGWLLGESGWRVGRNQVWMVREEALWGFLENPHHWHRWQPERIPDPGLRGWAMALRGGVRFLTLGEAAAWLCRERQICVERATVASWTQKGWLPSVRNGNHLVRLADLATFEQPAFGQGSRKTAWDPCARCGDPDGPIKAPCVTPARYRAARYGFGAGLVCSRCYRRLRTAFERGQGTAVAA